MGSDTGRKKHKETREEREVNIFSWSVDLQTCYSANSNNISSIQKP
jgi:hypothetical protein